MNRTFKGTTNLPKQAGVSTYLALTFGTLLSSQGTDASFVLTLSGFPPGASLLCFQPYQTLFRSVSGPNLIPVAFGVAFCLSADPDFIRSISAELIGFVIRMRESNGSAENSFPQERDRD
ncbi:hypothetical protein PZB75_10415 [Streptomyces sp. AM 4-1-1]|uniref:hypothetical protein n=1 Tax=Streptomyces sp. AM 4-1-1 TaxID=3028710 RepID=UPI0023BA28BE|nr:hypothetical protein [Streptomyces sp. AM 4-1-1]WEH33752.1 hypothetical protein PZB75_10415 [Streptomyces sp. AM 4-1-1]